MASTGASTTARPVPFAAARAAVEIGSHALTRSARKARRLATTDRRAEILAESERLLARWRSEGRSPAEVRALYRAYVEAEMLRLVGGPRGLQREIERRRKLAAPLNMYQAIKKRNFTETMSSSPSSRDPITVAKAELRRAAVERRDALPAAERQRAAETIAARELPVAVAPGTIASGYFPMKSEIDPLPLLRRLATSGARLALPVVAGKGKPLIMRAWSVGEPLVAGVWGIREPGPQAPEVEPDVLIVPLLAFDRRGHRIGYGAGYYDMTIATLRAKKPLVAVGIAFAAQEIAAVPTDASDARLDLVLTEREAIDCRVR